MNFVQFKNEWLGRVVDYDHVFQYQCVDLILQYLYECYGIASGVSGNAIDYWVKTGNNGFNEPLLTKFEKIANSDAEQGDIVILNGLPGNPFGHIGIATGSINATELEILEQNGADGSGSGQGGNVIRVRYIARSRVAGVLRPKVPASSPAPAPVPPAGDSVFLPANISSWAIYHVGSQLRKGTSDQVGTLAPARFGGLTYKIISWISNYAVVINTQDFGHVALWVKDTPAQFVNSAPAAPAPPVVVHPYTIENITAKEVKINKDTHLWGLNYDNFTAIDNNPEGNVGAGEIKIIHAILHHNIGYTYYLEDPAVASGYNVVDCDDFNPPPPIPPPNPTPPAAPLTAPSSETFELIKDVDGYVTSTQAANHVTPKVKIPAGTYFVFNKRFLNDDPKSKLLAVNLTKMPGKAGAWVNPDDNSNTPPAAEGAEAPKPDLNELYKPVDKDGHPLYTPQIYVAMKDLPVIDLSGAKKTVTMPKYSVTYISGTVELDSIKYAIPKTAYEKGFWYAIEWTDRATNLANLELEADVFNPKTTVTEREATRNLKPLDRVALAVEHTKKILLGFAALFSKIKTANKNKN